MSISGINSNPTPSATWSQWETALQQRQDFSQLALALTTGDLTGAQKAFADLKSLQLTGGSGSSLQNDLAALGSALASNDLTQAQNDFAQLQNDIQGSQSGSQTTGARGRHHHHHHHVDNSQNSPTSTSDSTASSTDSTASNTGIGTAVNVTA